MKRLRLILGTALILFVVGFLSGFYLLKLTENSLGITTIGFTLWDSLTPNLSLGFLLAFCSLSAGIISWAYSKSQLPQRPILIFSLGLLISIISASISIWLKLLQAQLIFPDLKTNFGNNPLITQFSTGSINYFSWGFEAIFFVSGIITIALLWISRWRKNNAAILGNTSKKRDVILIISTLAISSCAFVNLVGFLCHIAPLISSNQPAQPHARQSLKIENQNLLIVQDKSGVALIDFIGVKQSDSISCESNYQWRYKDFATNQETSGNGNVMEKYTRLGPISIDSGSIRYLNIGDFSIEWSCGSIDYSYVYYYPEKFNVSILSGKDFQTYALPDSQDFK
jgi:hypothetical protein